MQELIYEASIDGYRQSKKLLRALRTLNTDKAEREIIGGMISDCDYTLEWLRSGRRPGSMRGIERQYRVKVWDPEWIERYQSKNTGHVFERDTSIMELSASDRLRIDEAMHDLSDREKQCFVMHHVDLMTFEEISIELHVGRSSVQTFIERAREKIEHGKLFNKFLF